jgi:hypothetical protein
MMFSRRTRLLRGAPLAARQPAVTLVVGIGGGVTGEEPGLLAMRALATRCFARADVRFGAAGVDPSGLAADLESGCDLLAIGEAKLGAPPCAVTMLAGPAADRLLASPEYCEHAGALCALLARLRLEGRLPARRAVLNVEPPPVAAAYAPRAIAAAVARASAEALALIETWRLLERVSEERRRLTGPG